MKLSMPDAKRQVSNVFSHCLDLDSFLSPKSVRNMILDEEHY